jgi:2-polyprenyl-3-methyl-5-hydroxy-6-metoxy-1,4-benzoquinol methylase
LSTDVFTDEYEKRVIGEKRHFEKLENFSQLPEIVDWWSAKYLRPRIHEVFGYSGGNVFYSRPVIAAASSKRTVLVASLGSGDGQVEIALAQEIRRLEIDNVKIVGFELSKDLVSKATRNAEKLNISDLVEFDNSDVNASFGSSQFDLIIANQVLHHIVMLEGLLDSCHDALKDDGLIMTRDMIGKNGHQSWPEAREVVDHIWSKMPDKYKGTARTGKFAEVFPNEDFSKSGFEGIRSQDIMPLIIERFGYSHFYSFGGIVERFINRSFGKNYSVESLEDIQFIERLQKLNDDLLDSEKNNANANRCLFHKEKN